MAQRRAAPTVLLLVIAFGTLRASPVRAQAVAPDDVPGVPSLAPAEPPATPPPAVAPREPPPRIAPAPALYPPQVFERERAPRDEEAIVAAPRWRLFIAGAL